MSPTPPPASLSLSDPRARNPEVVGAKASRLAELLQAGFPVPDGLALSPSGVASWPTAELRAAVAELGFPVAVRSSGIAEDLAGASFAGQYETVLDVCDFDALDAAIRTCAASADAARVAAYRAERGVSAAPLAILVQRMVPADAAGVAFTADPVTGARDVVVVSAVAGLGEALVSGAADAEEWEVREAPVRRRGVRTVLSPELASRVADLARRVAGGAPTDVEWAVSGGAIHLLQARPMTAVPEPVSWDPPVPGGFIRNFRLGEWLGAPMTPLTDTWLVTDLERRVHAHFTALFGVRPSGPLHVTVNGWYFYGGMNYSASPLSMLALLPRIAWSLLFRFSEVVVAIPPLAWMGFRRETGRWRSELLPAWRRATEALEAELGRGDLRRLRDRLQDAISAAGDQTASIVGVAGYAAKAELPLFEFWRANLARLDGSVHELVVGADTTPAAHDVEGLDWVFPTLGERGPLPPGPSAETRERLARRRDDLLSRARAALAPRLARRLDRLVAEAREAHAVRLEQTAAYTLAWPAMRRALLEIGGMLAARGVISAPDDVFFLTRAELDAAIDGGGAPVDTAVRRATWERQRRLAPPLVIGRPEGLLADVLQLLAKVLHHEEHDAPDALVGMPGSPGRVTGPARVVRSIDELGRLQPGEILVCPVTTPGWTPAFARAAAIVTDTGSVASHASIVAREHGIPAVVATGTGTTRIADGQRITVDGGRGVVRLGA